MAPPVDVSTTNVTPLGPRVAALSTLTSGIDTPITKTTHSNIPIGSAENQASYMMASLSNKNKRRGYKVPPAVLPEKIIFGANDGEANTLFGASSPSGLRLRLITPSERQERGDLPLNIFVTSVDVEADLSSRKPRLKKPENSRSNSDSLISMHTSHHVNPTEANGRTQGERASDMNSILPNLNREEAECRWSMAKVVDSLDMLHPNSVVGWKVSHIRAFMESACLQNLGTWHQSCNIYS